jgi:hypothetical protein
MAAGNKLVDDFETLQNLKKELEKKEEELKGKIIKFARKEKTDTLFGSNKKCLIKPCIKIIYPEDKSKILGVIKQKGLYEKFSQLNYLKLNLAIINGELGKKIASLTKKKKDFSVELRGKG